MGNILVILIFTDRYEKYPRKYLKPGCIIKMLATYQRTQIVGTLAVKPAPIL